MLSLQIASNFGRRAALVASLAGVGVGAIVFHPGVALADPIRGLPKAPMAAGDYDVDSMHCSVTFEIRHLGLSRVAGRFDKVVGKVHEDPAKLADSSVDITIDADSVNTAVPPRDEHLRSKDFFDVKTFPKLTFKSTKVEKAKDGYVLTGDLTIRDKTKSVKIPFRHFGPYAMTGYPTRVGIEADPIVIKRSDFGLGDTKPMPDGTMGVSDEVTVRISFEATEIKG